MFNGDHFRVNSFRLGVNTIKHTIKLQSQVFHRELYKLCSRYTYAQILQFRNIHDIFTRTAVQHNSPAMLSPRGQSGLGLGLGVETLASTSASASKLWPRPRGFGLSLASISLSYYVIGYFSCKNRVKFGNFFKFFRQ